MTAGERFTFRAKDVQAAIDWARARGLGVIGMVRGAFNVQHPTAGRIALVDGATVVLSDDGLELQTPKVALQTDKAPPAAAAPAKRKAKPRAKKG